METVTLTFNVNHLSVISDALVNMPYRVSAPVIDCINAQIMQQQADEEIAATVSVQSNQQENDTHGA